jgi:hypothetical protein
MICRTDGVLYLSLQEGHDASIPPGGRDRAPIHALSTMPCRKPIWTTERRTESLRAHEDIRFCPPMYGTDSDTACFQCNLDDRSGGASIVCYMLEKTGLIFLYVSSGRAHML